MDNASGLDDYIWVGPIFQTIFFYRVRPPKFGDPIYIYIYIYPIYY